MNKNKNTLSKQKKLIIILAALCLLLAAGYFAATMLIKEQECTVLKIDEKGDYVEAVVRDSDVQRGINLTYIESVLSGKQENKYNIKPGNTDNVYCTFNADGVEIMYFPMVFPEVAPADIDTVEITNAYGSFEVFLSDEGVPFIRGAEKNLYNTELLTNLILQARYMISNSRLENTGDLSQYGLERENTGAVVCLKTKSGKQHTVLVGNEVSGGGYYMKNADKDFVYIMDSTCQVFFNDVKSYLSPAITRTITEQQVNYIESFKLVKQGQEYFSCRILSDDERVGKYANQLHVMTYPSGEYTLNIENLYTMFSTLGALKGSAVVEYNVSGLDELEYKSCMDYYGLLTPYAEISYTLADEDYSFTVGNVVVDEATGEKYCYVYSPYMDTIVLLSLYTAPFVEYELLDFVQSKVFQHNINDIDTITLTGKESKRVFVLENKTVEDKTELFVTEKNTGLVVDTPSFRQFYISLLNVNLDGYSSLEGVKSADELEHELTFDIVLKSGEHLTYAFYSESTLRCYMVVDGKGEFYTKREYIDKISKYSDMLMNGETITSSYY